MELDAVFSNLHVPFTGLGSERKLLKDISKCGFLHNRVSDLL